MNNTKELVLDNDVPHDQVPGHVGFSAFLDKGVHGDWLRGCLFLLSCLPLLSK